MTTANKKTGSLQYRMYVTLKLRYRPRKCDVTVVVGEVTDSKQNKTLLAIGEEFPEKGGI